MSEELGGTPKSIEKLKETNLLANDLGGQQTSHRFEEEAVELVPNTTNYKVQQAGKVQQSAKSHPQVFCQSQARDPAVSQLQGATPVKLSRKELRHIPASELSSRRSGLTGGINAIPADAIEMPKKCKNCSMQSDQSH